MCVSHLKRRPLPLDTHADISYFSQISFKDLHFIHTYLFQALDGLNNGRLQHESHVFIVRFRFFSQGDRTNALLEDYQQQTEMSSADQPVVFRLLLAMWYNVLSHSEMLCYFMIFLNQIKTATFSSLPLPIMVFLWGTLTIPRPSKTFWVTIIAYTEVNSA